MLLSSWQGLLALGFTSCALATQALIAERLFNRDLEIRQTDTSKCNPNGYKSINGMNFTTYCGQNNPFNDAQKPFLSPSMGDCMEHCSRFWGDGEGCFGVVWVEATGDCWIRNSTTSTKGLVQKDGHYSALVVQGNMDAFDTACPKEDKSVNTLPGVDGMKYTMNCGKVIGGFDTCFQGFPQPCWPEPYKGFYHTKTLEECLQICADQRPLCKAVSWSPDLKIGFANCWPKTDFPETLTTPSAKQGVIHSATITQIDTVDRTCPSAKQYRAQATKKDFDLHCGQLNSGTNITSIHMKNVTSCMDACANSDKNCIGIVFDPTLGGGYKNCYLQNTTNTISNSPSATYAVLSASASTGGGLIDPSKNNTDSSGSGSGSGSKAWIAGPVVGGIAAVGIIVFAIFWWRRRKAAKAAGVAEKDGREFGAYGPAPAYSPGTTEVDGQQRQYYDAAPVGELGQGEGAANELPGTTKYAHVGKQGPAELP